MEIVKNTKGIEILTIEEENFIKLSGKNKKFHGIYGANGAGKSSLKEAMIEAKPTQNWKTQDPPWTKSEIKFSTKNYAVFDERVVTLVRHGLSSTVKIFGQEVSNLYELLTNRTNFLKSKGVYELVDEELLKIDSNSLKDNVKSFENMLEYFQKLQNNKTNGFVDRNVRQKIIELINKELSEIVYPLAQATSGYSQNYSTSKSEFQIKIFNLPKIEQLFNAFNEKNLEEVLETHIQDAKQEIQQFVLFLKEIYFIVENFGYTECNNKIKSMFEKYLIFIKPNEAINKGNLNHLYKFYVGSGGDDTIFEAAWDEMYAIVNNVITISNNFLLAYDLGYKVQLRATVLNDQNNNNFSLFHINSKKELTEEQIENSVSFGELNIIALNIFIASILTRGIQADSILIFDDPVSSYDLNRVQISIGIIHNLFAENNNIEKTFFLSHEKHFIKSLELAFRDKMETWNLIKGDISKLEHVEEMESDFQYYLKLAQNKNELKPFSSLIAERFLAEIQRAISNSGVVRSVKTIQGEMYNEQNKDSLSIPSGDDIQKEDLIALKSIIKIKHDKFFTWLVRENFKITNKIGNKETLSLTDALIFRVGAYKNILDSINHSDKGDDIGLDTSRTVEKLDILYSSKKSIINDFKEAIEIWKQTSEN